MVRRKTKGGIPPGREVRERLIEVATELFARKGYAATTTREIVCAAGVTKPVLYYYFRSKEGIYLEIMEKSYKRFESVVGEAASVSGEVIERLLYLCDKVFELVLEKIDVVRIMYSIYYGPPQGAPFFDFDGVHQKLYEAIGQIVIEGIKKKELKEANPEDMTWAILGAFHVAMENELSHPERELGREGLRRILTLIFEGISRRTGRPGKGEKK
jgi:TetR/AcrR family transcriptional regulator